MNDLSYIESKLTESARKTEKALAKILAATDKDYEILSRAMQYSTLGGGKRIRPLLTLEFCRLFGGSLEAALPFAAAVEMIHCFSLIHDDLPCMDNDDLRRGRPTNHIVFGEAIALLAGDALSLLAFETIAANTLVSPEQRVRAALLLARASGRQGMVAGQVMDMLGEKQRYDLQKLKKMHRHKTGALIRAAAVLGCCAAGADEKRREDAARYAEGIGLAFQIIDDILDREGDAAMLGKATGRDEKSAKTTYLRFMSADEAKKAAREATDTACEAIAKYEDSALLCDFAYYLLDRKK